MHVERNLGHDLRPRAIDAGTNQERLRLPRRVAGVWPSTATRSGFLLLRRRSIYVAAGLCTRTGSAALC